MPRSIFLYFYCWLAWVELVARLAGWALVKRCGVRPWPLPFTPSPASVLFLPSFAFPPPFSPSLLRDRFAFPSGKREVPFLTYGLSVREIWSTSLTRVPLLNGRIRPTVGGTFEISLLVLGLFRRKKLAFCSWWKGDLLVDCFWTCTSQCDICRLSRLCFWITQQMLSCFLIN